MNWGKLVVKPESAICWTLIEAAHNWARDEGIAYHIEFDDGSSSFHINFRDDADAVRFKLRWF